MNPKDGHHFDIRGPEEARLFDPDQVIVESHFFRDPQCYAILRKHDITIIHRGFPALHESRVTGSSASP